MGVEILLQKRSNPSVKVVLTCFFGAVLKNTDTEGSKFQQKKETNSCYIMEVGINLRALRVYSLF